MKYLLDTNVVSEVMKPGGNSDVLVWLEKNQADCFVSSFTVAEIEKGIELLLAGRKKEVLREAFLRFLPTFRDKVIPFDLPVARRWAKLAAEFRRRGRQKPVLDSMIEATALQWNLTMVTRNTSDFAEVTTVNPWSRAN